MNVNKKTSINSKTLIYLIVFSVSLLVLLWIFQLVNLNYSYEKYQVDSMNTLAEKVDKLSNKDMLTQLENLAYESEVCMEFHGTTGETYYINSKMLGCSLGKNNMDIKQAQNDIMAQNQKTYALRFVNNELKAKAYLYGIKKDSGYVFIYNNLEDISGATAIVKNQLVYLTVVAIIFAILIAYFLSKKLTEPILQLTGEARKMGHSGKPVFKESGILEIDELAETLGVVQEEFAKTDEVRRDLMANVSHDLKTPLTMIKAYAEMVRDISHKDELKRDEHLNIIVSETDRLNILVNDLLSLSKLEAHAEEIKKTEFDLITEIKEVVKKYEIIKETEDYEFILEVPETANVFADKNKLNQVIYNLINNAINYTGVDKRVTVRVTEEKRKYLCEIIDTGKGIKEEEINRIWDKYYKNDKNHQRNVVGTGIGLSIVKNILVKHNFEYGVKSQKNKGTTFWFKVNKK